MSWKVVIFLYVIRFRHYMRCFRHYMWWFHHHMLCFHHYVQTSLWANFVMFDHLKQWRHSTVSHVTIYSPQIRCVAKGKMSCEIWSCGGLVCWLKVAKIDDVGYLMVQSRGEFGYLENTESEFRSRSAGVKI